MQTDEIFFSLILGKSKRILIKRNNRLKRVRNTRMNDKESSTSNLKYTQTQLNSNMNLTFQYIKKFQNQIEWTENNDLG